MAVKNAKLIVFTAISVILIILIIVIACFQLPSSFFVVTAVILSLVLAVTLCLLFYYCNNTQFQQTHRPLDGDEVRLNYSFLRRVAGLPTKFTYKELVNATDNFNALIGHGASGAVFKGILDDGTPVAVKMIESADYGEREFKAEITAIAGVQHVNLIRLLGYCIVSGGPYYLIYEFLQNGSLDAWIFPRKSKGHDPNRCLPWNLRYQVAIDVAKALAYLHHDCRSKVLHLDIKPENILLDDSFRAIVADFGLSKLMGRDQSRVMATLRGTKGYLAPEWLLEYGISEKSDVYSFGMVLLELVGGRRNVQFIDDGADVSKRKWSYFPKIVAEKSREGNVMHVLDDRLLSDGIVFDENEVIRLVNIALWCIQETSSLRPSMSRVVDMLEGKMLVDAPPETEMIVVDLLCIDDDEVRSGATGIESRYGGGQSEDRMTTSSAGYSFALSNISAR